MKFLKILLKIVGALIGIIILTAVITLWVDSSRISYLDIEKDTKNSYLITNVNIIPMYQDTVLSNKMVLVKDGIIEKIGDDITSENITIIDGNKKFLSPGLIDMHVHIWDRYELGLYLSNGVTAVRNLWGMPMHLRMKEDVKNGEIYAPTFFTSSPKLTGREFIGDDNLNLQTPEEAREKVIEYKERGYDFIKTYYGLDQDIFEAVIEQAQKSELDIAAHPSHKVAFSYHLHSQIKTIEHAEEIVQQPLQFDLNLDKLQPIIDSIATANHTNYSPTITVFNNIYQMMQDDAILDSEAIGYMNPLIKMTDSKNQFNRWYNSKQQDPETVSRIKNQHDFHLTIISKLHEAGVSIVCGSDAGIGVTIPGFSTHNELRFYKEAGLTNYEVLKTATVNASKTHAQLNSLGTIEEGKVANLLLLDENPLKDLAALEKPNTVFIEGRKLDRSALDSFNEKALNRKNLMATALRYAENLFVEK